MGSRIWAFDWYQNRWPWMTLNGIMAVILRYSTEFGSFTYETKKCMHGGKIQRDGVHWTILHERVEKLVRNKQLNSSSTTKISPRIGKSSIRCGPQVSTKQCKHDLPWSSLTCLWVFSFFLSTGAVVVFIITKCIDSQRINCYWHLATCAPKPPLLRHTRPTPIDTESVL